MKSKFLAIIPARGWSKRLPNKNILPLCNKPLITYTIEAALKVKDIDSIVVTTDNDEILSIAKQYKINSIKRSTVLSGDTVSTIDLLENVIIQYPDYEMDQENSIDIDTKFDFLYAQTILECKGEIYK